MIYVILILSVALFVALVFAFGWHAEYQRAAKTTREHWQALGSAVDKDVANRALFRTALEERDSLDAELQVMTEQRSVLLAKLVRLQSAVSCWRSHCTNYARQLRKTADNVERDGVAMDNWTAAQDEQSDGLARPPGEEERTSAETDEPPGVQNPILLSEFTSLVEAAGLTVALGRSTWNIKGGFLASAVYCQPLRNGRISYRKFGDPHKHEGTVADAIKQAGWPVEDDVT